MISPKIIYEDAELLVLDKPAGMVVNRAETTAAETTLQDWIEDYLKITSTKSQILNKFKLPKSQIQNSLGFRSSDLEFTRRAGIVHRLDKDTSGLILVAKSPESFSALQDQFKERKVKKTYLALVHGRVEPKEGTIRAPLGRSPFDRHKFTILAEGREAVTGYKILREREFFTLLELYPQTGRTHQIRVHLKSINHPIVSDALYAGRKRLRQDKTWCPRQFLHASGIEFTHPGTGKRLAFSSPMPDDLVKTLKHYV